MFHASLLRPARQPCSFCACLSPNPIPKRVARAGSVSFLPPDAAIFFRCRIFSLRSVRFADCRSAFPAELQLPHLNFHSSARGVSGDNSRGHRKFVFHFQFANVL